MKNEETKNKRMNKKINVKKQKISKIIYVIIAVLCIVVIALVINLFLKKEYENKQYKQVINEVQKNSSIKIAGNQEVSGIDISNIEVKSSDGKTVVNAVATNNKDTKLGNINVNISVETKNKIRILLKGYINEINQGEKTNITATLNEDISEITNIYFSE